MNLDLQATNQRGSYKKKVQNAKCGRGDPAPTVVGAHSSRGVNLDLQKLLVCGVDHNLTDRATNGVGFHGSSFNATYGLINP